MNALWPVGEATVRDIQQALQPTRPRAYTTIMTILDRLAQKGIVLRRKSGRAWVYQPVLTAEDARSQALAQLVEGFFAGSSEGLVKHLAVQREAPPAAVLQRDHAQNHSVPVQVPVPRLEPSSRDQEPAPPARVPEKPAGSGLDTSLL